MTPYADWDEYGVCLPIPRLRLPRKPRKKYKRNPEAWVKKTDKHTRYKIAHKFKYNPATEERYPHGRILYVYEHSDKLVFLDVSYTIQNKKKEYKSGLVGILKCKETKRGKSFNFYVKRKRWLNVSNDINGIAQSYISVNSKTHCKRLRIIIKKFAQKLGRKFEAESNTYSIGSGIIRLCYPSLNILAPDEKERIGDIDKRFCRYLRNPNSRFVKKLQKQSQNNELSQDLPRYFRQVYSTKNSPSRWYIEGNLKYIRLDNDGAKMVLNDDHRAITEWSKERFMDEVKRGRFIEIPKQEVALM